jgi:hypothetical protein
VITIFCHSRVGKTTTEVAFEFPSVVLEPNIRDRNFRVADIRIEWPSSRPLPTATDSLYGILTKSSCPLYVFGSMLSKESVYREQCGTNFGILHKPADSWSPFHADGAYKPPRESMSRTLLSLAGFQVILSGRFWVIGDRWGQHGPLAAKHGFTEDSVF